MSPTVTGEPVSFRRVNTKEYALNVTDKVEIR
jgi:hypothetical protein